MEIPLGFCIAFPCVLSNRLLLNIRGLSRGQPTELKTVTVFTTRPSYIFTSGDVVWTRFYMILVLLQWRWINICTTKIYFTVFLILDSNVSWSMCVWSDESKYENHHTRWGWTKRCVVVLPQFEDPVNSNSAGAGQARHANQISAQKAPEPGNAGIESSSFS